jgi:hypothetical protein
LGEVNNNELSRTNEKGALLKSEIEPSVIRTKQLAETVFGVVQGREQLPHVDALYVVIVVHVLPPLVEYSIKTVPEPPPLVKVTVREEQPVQFSPPLGEVIVMNGEAIANTALLTSKVD